MLTIHDVSPRFDTLHPEVQRRQRVEFRVIETAIARILATGNWALHAVDYGDDEPELTPTLESTLKLAFDLDDCTILFKSLTGRKKLAWFRCVFGNDGWDVIADYAANDTDFDAILEQVGRDADGGILS